MYLDLEYDDEFVKRVVLQPDPKEDPEVLHNYSKLLKVSNPAIQFTMRAKKGEFNDVSDEEYTVMLCRIKEFSTLFFDGNCSRNIFRLAADMAEYILKNDYFAAPEEPEDYPEDLPEDDPEDIFDPEDCLLDDSIDDPDDYPEEDPDDGSEDAQEEDPDDDPDDE